MNKDLNLYGMVYGVIIFKKVLNIPTTDTNFQLIL